MTNAFGFLGQLEQVIADRRDTPPDNSYTASLLASGLHRIAQKVGEEGVELALAAVGDDRERIVAETADLLYHVMVLLTAKQLSLGDVVAELERRHRP
ncbi:MAG: phosphoribosyl-ATP diphosphatase [Gammaproteobacteria bacterium]|nr:phosphoribosyl-ATP diphosphatase [Gammaproteobacteria bacterium]MDH5276376.1 phosphoribosyl-ATP diphosphatase [Gammaproteobacteria bacterium]